MIILLMFIGTAMASETAAADQRLDILWLTAIGLVNLLVVGGLGAVGWLVRGAISDLKNVEARVGDINSRLMVLEDRGMAHNVADLRDKVTALGVRGERIAQIDARITELNDKIDEKFTQMDHRISQLTAAVTAGKSSGGRKRSETDNDEG